MNETARILCAISADKPMYLGDLKPINGAILKRWSPSGLQWIKTQAWERIESLVE